MIKITRLQEAD